MQEDKAGWQRGTPVATLSEDQVARILAEALPTHALRSFELLTGGLSNTNYRLHVEGLKDFLVLRVYCRDPSACQKEVDLHRLVSDRVPVPEVLYAKPDGSEGIGPHVLMRWVEGLTYRQLKSRRDVRAIAEAGCSIGATLARVGTFTFPRPGPICPGLSIGPPFIEGPDPLPTFIEGCLSSPEMTQRLDSTQTDRLRDFIWRWSPQVSVLDEDRCLVHSDFNSPNILVDQVDGRWVVVGVLDWEFAFSGSPLLDIGNILRYERRSDPRMEPHFSAGFRGGGGVLPQNWRELSRVVDLTSLCEILTRPHLPEPVVNEVVELINATVEGRDPP